MEVRVVEANNLLRYFFTTLSTRQGGNKFFSLMLVSVVIETNPGVVYFKCPIYYFVRKRYKTFEIVSSPVHLHKGGVTHRVG